MHDTDTISQSVYLKFHIWFDARVWCIIRTIWQSWSLVLFFPHLSFVVSVVARFLSLSLFQDISSIDHGGGSGDVEHSWGVGTATIAKEKSGSKPWRWPFVAPLCCCSSSSRNYKKIASVLLFCVLRSRLSLYCSLSPSLFASHFCYRESNTNLADNRRHRWQQSASAAATETTAAATVNNTVRRVHTETETETETEKKKDSGKKWGCVTLSAQWMEVCSWWWWTACTQSVSPSSNK